MYLTMVEKYATKGFNIMTCFIIMDPRLYKVIDFVKMDVVSLLS